MTGEARDDEREALANRLIADDAWRAIVQMDASTLAGILTDDGYRKREATKSTEAPKDVNSGTGWYVVKVCDDEHPSRPGLRCARRDDHDGTHAHNGTTWPRREPCPSCGHYPHIGICLVDMAPESVQPALCRCGA